MKTVLFISGNTALWACFKHHKVVDFFEELITQNTPGAYTRVRWMKAKTTEVHLLIDAERSEIDAHPLLETGSTLRYLSNKRALRQRLIERYPDAIVQSAAKKIGLGTVLVQHINLPDHLRDWIADIEVSGVTVCSTTTVAELLANQCAANCSASSYMVISATSAFIRHTFCQSGYALFTRVVGSTDSQDQFKQTLSHLRASELINCAVPVFAVGLSENAIAGINTLEFVSELVCFGANENSTGLFLSGLVLESVATRNNYAHRHVSYAMKPCLERRRHKNMQRQYAAVALLVLLSVGYTLSNEWRRLKLHKHFFITKSELRQTIALYKNEAIELSPQSAALSSALIDRVAVESAMGLSPAILLTVLAQAFSQFRELELQELSWVVVDARSAPGLSAKVTQVTLAGSINLADSLRAQQEVLNAFAAHLQTQDKLSNLTVLRTPLMQFDGTASVTPIDSLKMPRFELQFDLNRLAGNDA